MSIQRDFKGVWIPKEIWLDTRLTALDKIIFTEIDSLDSTERGCYASNEVLAEFCQCSITKISKAISKLIDIGYVYVKSFDGRVRELKSCFTVQDSVTQNTRQTCKKCKADLHKMQENNTDSNTFIIEKELYKEKEAKSDEPFVADESSAVHETSRKDIRLTDKKQPKKQQPLSKKEPSKLPHEKTPIKGTKPSDTKNTLQETVIAVVAHLNAVLGTKYRTNTPLTVRLIKTRISEGFTADDFIKVIDKKAKAWKNTEYARFLRPETLFGNKFESYLNEALTRSKAPFTQQHYDNERIATDDISLLKDIVDIDF